MEEERPNYYAIIPASVRYDDELKPNEKLIYGEITSLCDNLGYCWATNKYFATLYKVEPETISRWINNLVKRGYLHSEMIYKENSGEILNRVLKIDKNLKINLENLYRKRDVFPIDNFVNDVLIKKSIPYCSKNQDGIDKKVKDNNTSINNTSTTTNINNISTNLDSSNNKNIYEIIEENFGRTLNSIEYEEIKSWNEYNFPFDLLKYAVKQAVLNGKYYVRYISIILYQYHKDNIKTVQQAQQRDLNFQENKAKSKKSNYKSPRDKLRELEEQARIEDEMEALKNAKS